MPSGPLCILETTFWSPYLSVLFLSIYWVSLIADSFDWDTEQEKTLQQIQASVQAALLQGHIIQQIQ